MAKGRFLNQKLGKRVSRKIDLLKSRLAAQRHPPADPRFAKKGLFRQPRPSG